MFGKRRLNRREFMVGAAAALGGAALVGCGGSPSTPPASAPKDAAASPASGAQAPAVAKKVKLQWVEWITPEIGEERMKPVLDAFAKTDAGKSIEIERLSLPNAQVRDKIVALHLAGQVPDVLNMNAPWQVELAEQGILEPLNDYLDKEGKAWTDNLVKGPMIPWKGKYHLVTLTSIPFLLFYNEKKLAEAGFSGPPKSWADVEAMGPKLTNPSKNSYCYASGMAAQSPYNGANIELAPLIYQSNDTYLKDGKCNLTSPGSLKALKFWLKLVNDLKIYAPGVLTNMEKDKVESFAAEQTALCWTNVAFITVFEQRNPQLKFGLAPYPEGDTFGTVLTGWNTSMAKSSKNKEAAWEFIRWLSGPEGNAKMALAAKHLPGNAKADVSEMFQADPRLKVALEVLSKGRVFMEAGGMPETTNLWRIWVEQVHEAASKKKTPEEAMQFASDEWNKVIAKYA